MTLFDLLCNLREQLIAARDTKDRVSLEELSTTFTVLEETTTRFGSKKLSAVIDDLGFAARDSLTGTDWKSTVPSIATLKDALDEGK
jgi:hypothetical protein